MGTRKKRHLIAGTIIGGLLLAATTQTGNSFALSDTSSASTGGTTTTSQQAPTSNTSSGDSTSTTPLPTPGTDTNATGSTATQSATTTAGATTTAAAPADTSNSTTPTTTDPSIDPTIAAQTNTTTATNKITSKADTGDATIKHTTDGGNATSGDANGTATLINSIASSSNLNSGNLKTFNYDVNGNQNGNIVINPNDILSAANSTDPSSLANCLPTGSATADNNSTINNLITLLAKTGNANVSDNGVGGNATSGNATTEANVVNMIQDMVSNQGAFLGVININGNLNGNIELPASVINSLLTPTQSGGTTGNTSATNNDNINNNVTLTAISGNAAVTNNGVGGNATSGNAATILESCNIINSNIVGGNLLLVFVNVMGHWYGALLSEPAGDTTATLGGGITQDTQTASQPTTATNNATINNNLNLTSISGNATVANNGVGGNATTGSATAIADITNILGSQINLSGWLGILIINVFGTWNGGLVIQPTATNLADPGTPNNSSAANLMHHSAPVSVGSGAGYTIADPPQSFDAGQFDLASAHVLGDSTTSPNSHVLVASNVKLPSAVTTRNTQTAKRLTADFILAGIGAALAASAGITRIFTNQRKKG